MYRWSVSVVTHTESGAVQVRLSTYCIEALQPAWYGGSMIFTRVLILCGNMENYYTTRSKECNKLYDSSRVMPSDPLRERYNPTRSMLRLDDDSSAGYLGMEI